MCTTKRQWNDHYTGVREIRDDVCRVKRSDGPVWFHVCDEIDLPSRSERGIDHGDAERERKHPCRPKHRRVHPENLSWTWDAPRGLEDLVRPVVLDAAELLTASDHTRIGHCPACDWMFYDTTKNRSRRWCDMADCVSRDKAHRYYHRVRGQRR